MVKVALVTGGLWGIGAAISTALKDAGHTVAATYLRNDEAAAAFASETDIKTYKWDVLSCDAYKQGIEKIEAEIGPVELKCWNEKK